MRMSSISARYSTSRSCRMSLLQRLGGWSEGSVVPPVPCLPMIEDEPRREVQLRPRQEECEGCVPTRISRCVSECAIERLELGEVRKMCEVVPQHSRVQSRFKGLPSQRLGRLAITLGLKNADLQLNPREIRQVTPTCGSIHMSRVYGKQDPNHESTKFWQASARLARARDRQSGRGRSVRHRQGILHRLHAGRLTLGSDCSTERAGGRQPPLVKP
jgi:hypothetical protein